MSEPQILTMEQVDELERGATNGQYLHKMSALDLIATIRSKDVEIERLNENIDECSDWLAACRDIILDNHNHGGISDEFYDTWMPMTVPDPSAVPDLVKAEIERLETKYYTMKETLTQCLEQYEAMRVALAAAEAGFLYLSMAVIETDDGERLYKHAVSLADKMRAAHTKSAP